MDSFEKVIKALLADRDSVLSAAREALGEIEQKMGLLRQEADLVRRTAVYAEVYQGRSAESAQAALLIDEEEGLTDVERAQMNVLIDQALATQPAISNESMLDIITRSGIDLSQRVSRPPSVVGTMLYFARRRKGIPQPSTAQVAPPPTAGQPQPTASQPTMVPPPPPSMGPPNVPPAGTPPTPATPAG
jgi:hypothetical protein